MRSSRSPILLLAILVAGLLLSACGGDGDSGSVRSSAETSSGPAAEALQAATGKKPEAAAQEAKSRGSTKHGGDGSADAAGKNGAAKKSAGGTKANAGGGNDAQGSGKRAGSAQAGGTTVHIKGCPTGLSKSECAEVGKAYEEQKQSTPNVVAADECPGAMSKSECEAAGAAYQGAQGKGHIVQPNECPRAMTEQQCREAGAAYQESLK